MSSDFYTSLMKLYRGFKELPKIFIPKLAQEFRELQVLHREAVEDSKTPLDIIRIMGQEKFLRWAELGKIAGAQFFTDQEQITREVAGDKGYVLALEVDNEIAQGHYQGEQIMERGGERRYISNFVFSGEELARLAKDNQVELIDIAKELAEQKEITEISEPGYGGSPERRF